MMSLLYLVYFPICLRQRNYAPDDAIGSISMQYGLASLMWADRLVDPLFGPLPHSEVHISRASRPFVKDLLIRMNRPIVVDIVHHGSARGSNGAADDLAAGITYWTLQWRVRETGKGNELLFHKRAEHYLQLAGRKGNQIQRSFALMAYANCAIRFAHDGVALDPSPLGSFASRLAIYRIRLQRVYLEFKHSVPQRALLAAAELTESFDVDGDIAHYRKWRTICKTEFSELNQWNCYK